jgi:hypothetical protein
MSKPRPQTAQWSCRLNLLRGESSALPPKDRGGCRVRAGPAPGSLRRWANFCLICALPCLVRSCSIAVQLPHGAVHLRKFPSQSEPKASEESHPQGRFHKIVGDDVRRLSSCRMERSEPPYVVSYSLLESTLHPNTRGRPPESPTPVGMPALALGQGDGNASD